ncbi:MAG: M16 family metallopeptidase [Armatimonadota bacterium]
MVLPRGSHNVETVCRKDLLPNGVRVVTESVDYANSVSLGIWIGSGSRNETDAQAGISHFIEHMMFKGTRRRSAREIAESLDSVGGRLNAFTDKEYTCYYAKVLAEDLPLAFDVLADMLLESRMDVDEIEREKNVVVEEIKRHEDSPEDLVHDIFARTLWPDHPLGRPVIGFSEVVEGFTQEDVLSFIEQWYKPDRIVVTAAGKVDHEKALELTDRYFGRLSGHSPELPHQPPHSVLRTIYMSRSTEQVHLCIGTPGIPHDSEDRYAMAVMDAAYGGGMSSRLFQEIRESRGLVYSIGSYFASYREGGLFAVYAGTSRETADEVVALVEAEGKRLSEEGITEEELERAKRQIRGSMILGLESTSARMTRLGKLELAFGRVIPVEEVLERIEAVTLDEVHQLSARLLNGGRHAVAAIGPFDECPAAFDRE